jgi:hypothetical protein
MTEGELVQMAQPIKELLEGGKIWGMAYLGDRETGNFCVLGSNDLTNADMAVALYTLLDASHHNVEDICVSVIMYNRKKQHRN